MKTIVVCGQTGVGKSDWSDKFAAKILAEIVNIDMGQMYDRLSIGTAKPDMNQVSIKHHLYGCLKTPEDMNVVRYREIVKETIESIHAENKNVVLVGGSMFYIEALFYELMPAIKHTERSKVGAGRTWAELHAIDPVRASQIHPSDVYRIERALSLWYSYGVLPSQCIPRYNPVVDDISIIWLERCQKELRKRIDIRVDMMLEAGWVEEALGLPDEWKQFVRRKKLCGYDIIVNAATAELSHRQIDVIKKTTYAYAKRQYTSWKRLKKKLEETVTRDHITMIRIAENCEGLVDDI